jgi:hypothetical protein
MSSHRKTDPELVDLGLKHALKNWVQRNQPPLDGKTRLINSAMGTKRTYARNRVSRISGLASMSMHESFLEIYLASFRITPYYSLQPGSMGLNFSRGVIAR